ncbi:NUDIX domain-containing protein [Streptomyces sp. NPDC058697]|uniref:NUDIX domain-containing protein n=1 Tax=Streptomyces sp. NPDC058697 TaxID=3346605 RepID=UPI00365C1D34
MREAARAIVLDAEDRLLLLRYDENGGFWATPGGSLEDGEDYATATLRELHEELGIDEKTDRPSTRLPQPSGQQRRSRGFSSPAALIPLRGHGW